MKIVLAYSGGLDTSVMLTLRPDELAAVQRSLRARAPQLFE